MNKGTETSIRRGEESRVRHRALIMALPAVKTGFSVYDIPLDRSVARRELKELVETRDLLCETLTVPADVNGRKCLSGTKVYRQGPPKIMRHAWVKRDNGIRLGMYYPPRPVLGFAELVSRHAIS